MAENEGLLCIGVSAVASGPAVRLFSMEGSKRCRPHLRCVMMGIAGGCLGLLAPVARLSFICARIAVTSARRARRSAR